MDSERNTSQPVMRDARLIVEHSLRVKTGERVTIVHDELGNHERDAKALADVSRERGADVGVFNNDAQVSELLRDPLTFPPPPPPDLTRALSDSNVIVVVTDFQWILAMFYVNYEGFASARLKAARAAALEQELGHIETSLDEIERTTGRVWAASRLLAGAETVHVTSPGGTDVRVSLEGRQGVHNAPVVPGGAFINLIPFYGETSFAPAESTGDGRIVVDGTMLGMGVGPHEEAASAEARRIPEAINTRFVETPVVLELVDGSCVSVRGGHEADRLRDLFAQVPAANVLAEFALGLSVSGPFAQPGMTARLGTAHFAFGDNIAYGGRRSCSLHQNGVVQRASIQVVESGQWLLRDGEWQLPD